MAFQQKGHEAEVALPADGGAGQLGEGSFPHGHFLEKSLKQKLPCKPRCRLTTWTHAKGTNKS